jgi:hypothetical protein
MHEREDREEPKTPAPIWEQPEKSEDAGECSKPGKRGEPKTPAPIWEQPEKSGDTGDGSNEQASAADSEPTMTPKPEAPGSGGAPSSSR